MLTGLDHLVLAVRGLDAACADYSRLLGLEPSWRGRHPEQGTANVLFRVENTYLELLAPDGDGPLATLLGAWLDANGEGLVALAFRTGDLEDCRRALAARGLEPSAPEAGRGRDDRSGAERHWRRVAIPPARSRGVALFAIAHDSPDDALPPAQPPGESSAAVHALDHVVLQTTDAEAVKAIYGDALGIRLALDREFPDWGVRLLFFRIAGLTVEVAALLSGSDAANVLPGGAAATDTQDRLYGMSWRVRDIGAARARLAAAGVDVSDVRTGRRKNTRVCTVRSGTCSVPTLLIELGEGER